MRQKLYFCENCRDNVSEVEDLHFVEESSDRGFCSEDCILEFYRPYMQAFEEEEIQFRKELDTEEEVYIDIMSNQHYMNNTLSFPDEVWSFDTQLAQKFYTHIKEINDSGKQVYYVLICSYVDSSPSFIFYKLVTSDKNLVDKYRNNEKVDMSTMVVSSKATENYDSKVEEITAEVLEEVESKKSQILAQMLTIRSSADIPIEEFTAYDSYMEETIQDPDEIYENEDDEGDKINTFIKSFQLGDVSFFYITLALQYSSDGHEMALLPIIGFPSVDSELYPQYAIGKRINETLKS